MQLSDNEKRDIVKYIEAGKPLPDKYRFLLFEDKREVELVWNGKTNEVTSVVLPFQVIEQVDEPRKSDGKSEKTQTSMEISADNKLVFDLDDRGRQLKGWTNKLIWGDNKLILSSLKNGPLRDEIEAQGGLKLIYIDPPFDVGADFSMDIEIGEGDDAETFHKEPSVLEELAYRDTWGKGADSFIAMIHERLSLMRDLLAKDGSIYVHCDWKVASYMKLLLDELFGTASYRNTIIWHYYNKMQGNVNRFPANHDLIFYYTKSDNFTFNPLKVKRGEVVKQIKRVWDKEKGKIVNAKDADGKVIYIETDEKGVDDVWTISMLQPADRKQNLNYPTQKPETIVERIINASSIEGDIIADFFCGSGTTLAVAEKLGRKWIGSDLGKFAIHTSRKRMISIQRERREKGEPYRAFEILNLGKYERQHYIGVNPNLREEEQQQQIKAREKEFLGLILKAYKAQEATGFRTYHGTKAGRMVTVGPVNLPVSRLFVEEVIAECREKQITKVDVLGFEFEMGLFPNIQEEAKGKGIDLALKYIPPDVFDKRAMEKDQVVFHDVAYIEIKPHVQGKKLIVELTDFSVFYTQQTVDNVAGELKNGKSKVTMENGQIVKVSKDNNIVHREVLTKKWTDWIDYWAVDYNFENKKEIIRVKKEDAKQQTLDGKVEEDAQTKIPEYEERWTGDYIFENEWQAFRTRKNRTLELKSAEFEYPKAGRYKIAVKVVDIFGNDTMKVLPISI